MAFGEKNLFTGEALRAIQCLDSQKEKMSQREIPQGLGTRTRFAPHSVESVELPGYAAAFQEAVQA